MLAKSTISAFLFVVGLTACGNGDPGTPDGCTAHLCPWIDREGGNIIFEYIHLDTELQATFHLPAGVTTVNRVMAYFMNAQTPDENVLPTTDLCNNLVTTKGWPEYVGSPHTDLDVGTLTITGKNMVGADVMIDIPKLPAGTDDFGRSHNIFYQVTNQDASRFLQPDSAYTVKFGGSASIPATTFPDGLLLPADFQVSIPNLEDNGPLVAGTDYTAHWTPAASSNLPGLSGSEVIGATWLMDTTGAPTHMCPTYHAAGQFKIPGSAITEYKDIAASRGLASNKVILLREALVSKVLKLPNGDANNQRRLDMLASISWMQLMDVN